MSPKSQNNIVLDLQILRIRQVLNVKEILHFVNALLRQAQKMQDDMKAKQAELEQTEYTASAPGEMVTVRMNGKHEVLAVTIKPEAVDPDDIEMLQDLVAAAVNAAVQTVDEAASAAMGQLTGGLNMPGLF